MRYQKANTLTCSSRFRAVQMKPDSGFQWFWERCNLMGSAKFEKLVDAYKWDEVMEVCCAQCGSLPTY